MIRWSSRYAMTIEGGDTSSNSEAGADTFWQVMLFFILALRRDIFYPTTSRLYPTEWCFI